VSPVPGKQPAAGAPALDRFLGSLDQLDRAIARVRKELDGLETANAHTRDAVRSGMHLRDLFPQSDGPRARDAVIEAVTALQSALMRSRGEFFGVLVEDEDMTISAVARLVGHPRQLVKRRYDAVRSDTNR
jgi:hypothetical protein